jgi:Zn-finger nucleic acid-binding protein
MEFFERAGYFFCRYCGSFHFPDALGADGVRVVGMTDRPAPCPVCRVAMSQALLDDAHPVRYCQKCRGVLVPRPAFAKVVNARRAWAATPPAQARPLDPRQLDRALTCPLCDTRMATHPYYGPGNVVLDTCDACDTIWLDFGELKHITDAPGRDRGSRDMPASTRPGSFLSGLSPDDARSLTSADDPLSLLFRLLS